jgi:hypothetical protein
MLQVGATGIEEEEEEVFLRNGAINSVNRANVEGECLALLVRIREGAGSSRGQ